MKAIQRTALTGFGTLLLLAGAVCALWPQIRGGQLENQYREETEIFQKSTEKEETEEEERAFPLLWEAAQEYNREIWENGQKALDGAESYEKAPFSLTELGADSEVFAVLSIPSIDLEMPVYFGATGENMAAGAAVLAQTSLPLGGVNTNAVLAGHRGWYSADYFLRVPELTYGDDVYVENLWETLHYRVTETKVIEPDDTAEILIRPGKDMLTLLTCHPYGSGGRFRWLVFCERCE